MRLHKEKVKKFQGHLLEWYWDVGRDLPWRNTDDPYHILVSEVMLQQTQVDRVIPKYHEFLDAFPTVAALARASRSEVLRLWSGLGYNSRAVRLHTIAQQVEERFGGIIPSTDEELFSLKGIGPYTNGAIQVFGYRKEKSFVDINIKRLIHRIFIGSELQGWKVKDKEINEIAEKICAYEECYDYHQGFMDLGAKVCKATKPQCDLCPMKDICTTKKEIDKNPAILSEKRVTYKKTKVPFKKSKRYIRGGVVEYLRNIPEHKPATFEELLVYANKELRSMKDKELEGILNDLVRDEVIIEEAKSYKI